MEPGGRISDPHRQASPQPIEGSDPCPDGGWGTGGSLLPTSRGSVPSKMLSSSRQGKRWDFHLFFCPPWLHPGMPSNAASSLPSCQLCQPSTCQIPQPPHLPPWGDADGKVGRWCPNTFITSV